LFIFFCLKEEKARNPIYSPAFQRERSIVGEKEKVVFAANKKGIAPTLLV
jgi:hypothetical protein